MRFEIGVFVVWCFAHTFPRYFCRWHSHRRHRRHRCVYWIISLRSSSRPLKYRIVSHIYVSNCSFLFRYFLPHIDLPISVFYIYIHLYIYISALMKRLARAATNFTRIDWAFNFFSSFNVLHSVSTYLPATCVRSRMTTWQTAHTESEQNKIQWNGISFHLFALHSFLVFSLFSCEARKKMVWWRRPRHSQKKIEGKRREREKQTGTKDMKTRYRKSKQNAKRNDTRKENEMTTKHTTRIERREEESTINQK